jgi:excisionase family DNA binding protein
MNQFTEAGLRWPASLAYLNVNTSAWSRSKTLVFWLFSAFSQPSSGQLCEGKHSSTKNLFSQAKLGVDGPRRAGNKSMNEKMSKSVIGDDGFLTKDEIARRCHRTTRTIETWMQSGFLPYFKIGKSVLFDWQAVQQHLRENHQVLKRIPLHPPRRRVRPQPSTRCATQPTEQENWAPPKNLWVISL